MNPFDVQIGGDHYKKFAFDPFKVVANWPKWAGDVFTYLIRNKGSDDYAKAMHTMAMWMDMDSKPQPQPLAAELTRHWVEMSYDAMTPEVCEVIVALGDYIAVPHEENMKRLLEAMYDLQDVAREGQTAKQLAAIAYFEEAIKKLRESIKETHRGS